MKIDTKQLQKLAALAQIELGPEETEAQRLALERVSTFCEKIAELDTAGLPCQSHPFGSGDPGFAGGAGAGGEDGINRFRLDEVTNEDRAEEWIAAAPDKKGLYIRVPRTVEE